MRVGQALQQGPWVISRHRLMHQQQRQSVGRRAAYQNQGEKKGKGDHLADGERDVAAPLTLLCATYNSFCPRFQSKVQKAE